MLNPKAMLVLKPHRKGLRAKIVLGVKGYIKTALSNGQDKEIPLTLAESPSL